MTKKFNSVKVSFNEDLGIYEVCFDPTDMVPKHLINAIEETMEKQTIYDFYNYNHEIAMVDAGTGPNLLSVDDLAGILNDFMHMKEVRGEYTKNRFPQYQEIKVILHSPQIKKAFPVLKHYTRSPIIDENWCFHMTQGYDEETGIYYDGPVIERKAGTKIMDLTLSEVNWKSPSDRTNFIGALITGLTIPLWTRGHPFVLFNGNQPGVGKSLLAKLAGIIIERKSPAMIRYEAWDSEMERQLATRLMTGERTIILDNAKGNEKKFEASSQVLESLITSETLAFRPLGRSIPFERINDVIFCMTANGAKLSLDLQRRCLPVNLDYKGHVQTKVYEISNLEQFVMDHFEEIVGELVNMVLSWVEAGKPIPETTAKHSVNQEWASTIDAILRFNGIEGFLENLVDSMRSYDQDYDVMHALCQKLHDQGMQTPSEWCVPIVVSRIMEDQITDVTGNTLSTRSVETTIGQLLSRNVGKVYEVDSVQYEVIMHGSSSGHRSKKYGFRPLGQQTVELQHEPAPL